MWFYFWWLKCYPIKSINAVQLGLQIWLCSKMKRIINHINCKVFFVLNVPLSCCLSYSLAFLGLFSPSSSPSSSLLFLSTTSAKLAMPTILMSKVTHHGRPTIKPQHCNQFRKSKLIKRLGHVDGFTVSPFLNSWACVSMLIAFLPETN